MYAREPRPSLAGKAARTRQGHPPLGRRPGEKLSFYVAGSHWQGDNAGTTFPTRLPLSDPAGQARTGEDLCFLASTVAISWPPRPLPASAWRQPDFCGQPPPCRRFARPSSGALKSPCSAAIKAVGFDENQSIDWQATPAQAEESRRLAESFGLRIHSVLFGWADMNQGKAKLAEGVAHMETALRAARACGASNVLFVPCRIGGMAMPEAWEFAIRFDAKTGHLRQVVSGDNGKYRKYIDAHNQAVDASRDGIRRLLPTAEKTGVVVGVENVWNNLWVKPDVFANFVASFDSPWVARSTTSAIM